MLPILVRGALWAYGIFAAKEAAKEYIEQRAASTVEVEKHFGNTIAAASVAGIAVIAILAAIKKRSK